MEAKFTPTVKNIIQYSREEAICYGQDYIGIEHLLLGILHDPNQENLAVVALRFFKVDVKKLYKAVINKLKPSKQSDTTKIGSIPLTKQTEKVLKITYLEAKVLKSDVINSYHVLLSILREEENVATQTLGKFNLNYDIAKKFSETLEYTESLYLEYPSKISQPSVAPPLGLIFDTSEYSSEDIKNILSLLSELYSAIGGDYLKVKGMNQFECLTELDLA